jgi:hypothetical protein
MAGLQPTTGTDVNVQLGVIARNVFSALADAQMAKAWLDTMPDATLTAAPYSLSQADVTLLKSAFANLNKLGDVFNGTVAHSPASDLRTFAKQVIGINY